jgi:hypothetical protein
MQLAAIGCIHTGEEGWRKDWIDRPAYIQKEAGTKLEIVGTGFISISSL